MPIKIRDAPQPLSPAAIDAGEPIRPWAASLAEEHLRSQLLRYTRGEILGRSVLISGYRGSGKTTLALQALQQVRSTLAAEGKRPLLVRIAGPSLMLNADGDGGETTEADVADAVGRVLERVTMVLVQAVTEEVHAAFRRRIRATDEGARGATPAELAELAARLRVSLEGMPTLVGLRDIWTRAGLLETGLFGGSKSRAAGFDEIRVLWSLSRASIITRGKVTETLGQESSARRSAEGSWELLTTGRELLNPLLGLMSGSLVGWGLLEQQDTSGFVAAAVGTLTGLATATTLNFSSKRLIESAHDQRLSVELDTSVYSLSLLLPRLVEQLRTIGLAPVFLVDELDKVRALRGRMRELVRHLKTLASEDAFFCFVTDRDYFEFLRWNIRARAYPEEHTYFTDRLYVTYMPQELHVFVRESLILSEGASELERADHAALPYVLLLRARLHLLDLRREMRSLNGPDGLIHLPAGSVCQPLHTRFEAAMQIAVEHVLAQESVAERCLRDAYFAQLCVDALYYLAERWTDGDAEVSLAEDTLRRHLLSRMDTEAFPATEGVSPWLQSPDLGLIHRVCVHMAEALSDASGVRAAAAGVGAPSALVDRLPTEALLVGLGDDRFAFRFDVMGRRSVS